MQTTFFILEGNVFTLSQFSFDNPRTPLCDTTAPYVGLDFCVE